MPLFPATTGFLYQSKPKYHQDFWEAFRDVSDNVYKVVLSGVIVGGCENTEEDSSSSSEEPAGDEFNSQGDFFALTYCA